MTQRASLSSAPATVREGTASPDLGPHVREASSGELGFLSLQQAIGNRAARDILGPGLLQPKLRIGPPGDRFEREADRMADAVLRMPADTDESPPTLSRTSDGDGAQRMCAECAEEEEEKVRRAPSPPDTLSPSRTTVERPRSFPITLGDLRGRGSPLPPAARSFFEPRFDHDFSDVRIHTGTTAAEASRSIHARAFTVGRDVVFGAGEYDPGSRAGRHLLAHELTHVVQQTPLVRRKPFGSETSAAEPLTAESAPEGTTEETREPSPNPSPETEPASQGAVARGLIVDDEATEVGPGQMRKSAFLAEVRTAICNSAEEAFAGTEHTTQGCPWIEAALRFYKGRSAERIERDMAGYVPEAAGVASAREYIPFITARVRRSTETWVETGEITGLPEGLPGMGLAGALVGSLASGFAGLFFKAKPGGPRGSAHPRAVQAQLGAGRSLPGTVRARMESAFGRGFPSVRVHSDAGAARLSNRFQARAFTVGEHVAFGSGEYRPGTLTGDALIAHELAHVVQQGATTSPTPLAQPAGARHDALERDADRSAAGVLTSLWGGAQKGWTDFAHGSRPRLRSGLSLQRCPARQRRPDTPAGAGATACPTLISMTAQVQAPAVLHYRRACRLRLGTCPTPRGQCGTTASSGAAISATVEAPAGCTGELVFAQNVLSSDRRRTLNDGTRECFRTTSPVKDGSIPWKGCTLTVAGPGRHSLQTDDCPSIVLRDNMTAASAQDSFKMFLLWKRTGEGTRHPIANVTWGWSGSTTRQEGSDCESQWTAPSGSPSTSEGAASQEDPVTSPHIRDTRWGSCD